MEYKIDTIVRSEYSNLVEVWELSVRATHHFLSDADIAYFKPLILSIYLDAIELRCVRNANDDIVGFSSVAEGNLEMLFIHPNERGKGIGKVLLKHAIETLKVKKVDVNEDNLQAIDFYKNLALKPIVVPN